MKKVLILMAILFFCANAVMADPFLVCTPVSADTVTHYLLKIDGAADPISSAAYGVGDNEVRLNFDMKDFSNGSHNLEIAAANVWGISIYTPFAFVKQVPGSPQNISIE